MPAPATGAFRMTASQWNASVQLPWEEDSTVRSRIVSAGTPAWPIRIRSALSRGLIP